MPRTERINAPRMLHHIICRRIERRAVFRDDTDGSGFVDRVAKLLVETATLCFVVFFLSPTEATKKRELSRWAVSRTVRKGRQIVADNALSVER